MDSVCALFACVGLGIGGNLPVDGALFLEFLPFASGNLLTLLSVWWPIGQLIGRFVCLISPNPLFLFNHLHHALTLHRSLVAWGFIPNFSCEDGLESCSISEAPCCEKADNMGWRYLVITLGAITFTMFICRFFLFHLYESPKFLLSRGRQEEAVAVVRAIAHKNKAKTWITTDILDEIGGRAEVVEEQKLSNAEIVKRQMNKFSGERVAPLFGTKKLGITSKFLTASKESIEYVGC